MRDLDTVRAAIHNALADEGHLITQWIAIAELIDGDDGEPCVFLVTHEGATKWGVLGLLEYAKQYEQASSAANETVTRLEDEG